jgi:hypothetical protein
MNLEALEEEGQSNILHQIKIPDFSGHTIAFVRTK